MSFEQVAALDDVSPGGCLSVLVDDEPVLLIRVGDNVFAIEDVCSHDGQPLTDGHVEDGHIVCPRHGARFDVQTGKATKMPATASIDVYSVEIRDGEVYVSLDD